MIFHKSSYELSNIENYHKEMFINDTRLVTVPQDSKEFREVRKKFKIGLWENYKVEKIQRLHNKHLWNSFCLKQLEINHKYGKKFDKLEPKYLEEWAWHGTNDTEPEKVVFSEEGIDKRFVKITTAGVTAGTFYGNGCYTADMPGYWDNQYIYKVSTTNDNQQKCQVLQWMVLKGKYDFGSKCLERDDTRIAKGSDIKRNYTDFESEFFKAVEGKSFNPLPYPKRAAKIKYFKWDKENQLDYEDYRDLRIDCIMDDYFMLKHEPGKEVTRPRMWVTFDNAQIYPKYLITYKRPIPQKANR